MDGLVETVVVWRCDFWGETVVVLEVWFFWGVFLVLFRGVTFGGFPVFAAICDG